MFEDDHYGEIQMLVTGLPGSARQIVTKSRDFRSAGEIDLALTLLHRAIAKHPAPMLLAEHADLLLERSEIERALDVAFSAITADPMDGQAQVVLSRVLLDALPDAFVYLVEVSKLYADEEEPGFAEELIRRAIDRHPNNVALRLHMARFYGDYARTAESVAELEEALRLNPENAEAHVMLAAAMLEDGDPAAAQAWLNKARVLGAESPMTQAVEQKILEVVMREQGER